MAYHPSPVLRGYDDSSSLDPLATSIHDEHTSYGKRQSSPTKQSSPCSLKSRRILEDIIVSSPQKTRKRNSFSSPSKFISDQTLSPWRIRVTVEAEPENMSQGNGRTTTRTVTVPLRQESPLAEVSKRKGTPRTSDSKRRSASVRKARSSSRSRRQNLTDLDITVLGDEGNGNDWREEIPKKKRGRPRTKKSKQSEVVEKQSTHAAEIVPNEEGHRGRKQISDSEDNGFEIRQDSDEGEEGIAQRGDNEDSPELRTIDLNRVSIRSRNGASRQERTAPDKENEAAKSSPAHPIDLLVEKGGVTSITATNYPTPASSIQDEFDVPNLGSDPTEHHEGFDTILESEGFTMIDIESIPSTRHFISSPADNSEPDGTRQDPTPARVSIEGISYPSFAPDELTSTFSSPAVEGHPKSNLRPSAIPSYLKLANDESELSSTIPSSPPTHPSRSTTSPSNDLDDKTQNTPATLYASPKLPSPPKHLAASTRAKGNHIQRSTPPRLARVVKAGIALQGVLSPKVVTRASKSPLAYELKLDEKTPRERLDGLFEGFDSGTRRELRAGLRFGEELAKRHKSSSPAEIQKAVRPEVGTTIWRGETVVQHTPIPPPSRVQEMVDKRQYPLSTKTSTEVKRVKGVPNSGPRPDIPTPAQPKTQVVACAHPDTQARREHEWQLEREAVSRQINNANTSQVIVIDSDDVEDGAESESISAQPSAWLCGSADNEDAADEEDGDIWLAEAEAHSSSRDTIEQNGNDLFPPAEQARQRERAREVVRKPRRSLIPSLWKRGEDIDGTSTFMTNGDVSGLLWQQPEDTVKFGAGAIKRQKSGRRPFDFDLVVSTPQGLKQGTGHTESLRSPSIEKSIIDQTERDENIGAASDDNISRDQSSLDIEDESFDGRESKSFETENSMLCEEEEDDEEDSVDEDISSPTPGPIKIPVNFNDSTLSAPQLTRSSPPSAADSSRPSTPRSALKGSRLSLGVMEANSPAQRKVVFSSQSLCLDESGQESSLRIQSLSPTPPPSIIHPGVFELSQPASPSPSLTKAKENPTTSSWFGWLWGSAKPAAPTTEKKSAVAVAATDGANDDDDDDNSSVWQPTSKAKIPAILSTTSQKLPFYLRPPSYPSDPTRDPAVPLATSGEFSDTHFRTMHIIYRKSLRPRFHAPDSTRPALNTLVRHEFDCDEGQHGYFAWQVDLQAALVVERFMQEIELGWLLNRPITNTAAAVDAGDKGVVKWGWSEKELCHMLFRIIVGEEVRREEG